MQVPVMTDICNDTLRRTVLVVFFVPAVAIATLTRLCEVFIESVHELPNVVRIVWRGNE